MLDFMFFKILYPLFRKQINKLLDRYRLAQVYSVQITKNGETYLRLTKSLVSGTKVFVYEATRDIYSPDESYEYLGCLEEVYGWGIVSDDFGQKSTRVLMHEQKRPIKVGLLVKSVYSQESLI